MSEAESEKLKELIEEVAMRHWSKISFKLFLLIIGSTAAIVSTLCGGTWYVANTLRDIEQSLSLSRTTLVAHEARLFKLETISSNPRTRWTVSMMLDWAVAMRDWAPGMPTPSVMQIQAAHIHEVTP